MKPFHSDDRFTVLSALIAFFTLFYFFQRKMSTFVHRFTANETILPMIYAAKLVIAIATGVICRVKSVALLHEIGKYVKKDRLKPILDEKLLASRGLVHQRGLYFASDLNFCKKLMSSSSWINRGPENYFLYCLQSNQPLGLFWGGGKHYKRIRHLTLKLLHQLDFYKINNMENLVSHAASELTEDLEKHMTTSEVAGGSCWIMSPHEMFQPYVLCILWQIMFGTGVKVSPKDPVLLRIHQSSSAANKKFNVGLPTSNADILTGLLRNMQFIWLAWCVDNDMRTLFKKIIAERRCEREGIPHQPNDFLDGLLDELDRTKGKDPYFTENSILATLRDMFLAGSDSASNLLEFALLHVALNQEIQDRVHAEIDRVIGPANVPSYSHRARMAYTQAVLLEVLRFGSIIASGTRVAKEDNTVDGINFPKDSMVVIRFFRIHRSKDLWEDPDVFRPERFIDTEGRLINTDKIIPFGYGQRLCIGENVGQLTLFIFFVSLMQKFRFQIPPELPPPSMRTQGSLSRAPMPFNLRVTQRL